MNLEDTTEHPILDRRFYPSVIDGLDGNKIFSITLEGDLFMFREGCDNYYDVRLSAVDLMDLAAELIVIASDHQKRKLPQ